MKITVMHVMNSITPTSSGYELASQLDTDRFNIVIVSFAGTVQIDDPRIIALNAKNKLDFKAIMSLNNIIRDGRIDVLHTHHNISGSIARILARMNNIPVIVDTEHGSHSKYKFLGNLFNDISLFLCDVIVNVSFWVNDSFSLWERIIVPRSRMHVLHNGVDLNIADQISNSSSQNLSFRADHFISKDDMLFLHAARLTKVKNQLKLIKGFARAVVKHPEAKLVIAGDGELKEALQNLVEELNMSRNIIFTGLLTRHSVYCLMKEADAFVMNSLSEGMSIALLEAMAFSLPCILSEIPSFRETVRGVDIGEFIESDDEKAVSEAFIRFLETDKYVLRCKGERARELARCSYSIDNTVREYEKIYMKLLSSKVSKNRKDIVELDRYEETGVKKCGIIIEFFGLPGAGKSTLAAEIASKLGNDVFYDSYHFDNNKKTKLLGIASKIHAIFKQVFTHPLNFIRQTGKLIETRQNSIRDLIKLIVHYFFIASVIQKAKHNNKIVILDQGIYQFIWSTWLNAKKRLDINSFLSLVKKPDLVIVLNVNEDTMCERLQKRNNKHRRLDRIVRIGASSKIKNAVDAFAWIAQYLNSEGINKIILDNNSKDSQEYNFEIIKNKILSFGK